MHECPKKCSGKRRTRDLKAGEIERICKKDEAFEPANLRHAKRCMYCGTVFENSRILGYLDSPMGKPDAWEPAAPPTRTPPG